MPKPWPVIASRPSAIISWPSTICDPAAVEPRESGSLARYHRLVSTGFVVAESPNDFGRFPMFAIAAVRLALLHPEGIGNFADFPLGTVLAGHLSLPSPVTTG